MLRTLIVTLLLSLSLPFTTAVQADDANVVVIANPAIAQTSIPLETLRAVFAMRQRSLAGGQALHVFVLDDDAPLHETFSKRILGVYPHQLRLAWERAVFSGTGQAPNQVASEAAMIDAVASTPGGIGYARQFNVTDRIRVLAVD
ncbi:hypothetical protein [Salinicola halophilus]|uniref:hypothetical protein n=1 Tax=Salinicola halophilus TaxID=184065 RepID=UPI00195516E0|nr:hypothetical protein [Salinicola halophilus]